MIALISDPWGSQVPPAICCFWPRQGMEQKAEYSITSHTWKRKTDFSTSRKAVLWCQSKPLGWVHHASKRLSNVREWWQASSWWPSLTFCVMEAGVGDRGPFVDLLKPAHWDTKLGTTSLLLYGASSAQMLPVLWKKPYGLPSSLLCSTGTPSLWQIPLMHHETWW